MHVDKLRHHLESVEDARPLLRTWGVREAERGYANLAGLAAALGVEALRDLVAPLGRLLPRCPDPDMALNNLERFLANPNGTVLLAPLVEGRARTLETLLQLFASSQYFSDLLAYNPDFLAMLRVPLRHSPTARDLVAQLQAEVDAAFEDSAVLRVFRRFRQSQHLRIATNDIIRDRPLEEITRDISHVADASLVVALRTALRQIVGRFGEPVTLQGEPARCVILAFGKHGGEELNYSSDIDLMFLYDEEGQTQGKRGTTVENSEFYGRVVSEVVRLLSHHTDRGQAYRIDLRLRPEGHRGPLARSLSSTVAYYDSLGRTWERQALIKLRPVAGNLELGHEFLRVIEPFVYRKYLSFAEINEIKALKRQIEKKAGKAGATETDVKTGRGGIRDIEFTIQFLQLLNGGHLKEVRQRNTLAALQALAQAGCLTVQEYQILANTYRFLRKAEHRLQIMFDLQTHRMPEGGEELRKLALRMGYGAAAAPVPAWSQSRSGTRHSDETQSPLFSVPDAGLDPMAQFQQDYKEKTDLNRRILDHLLHDTFQGEDGQASPEADLVLDPDPDPDTIRGVLARYPFRDVQGAYQNLTQLAHEAVPFLSRPRCRQFLASIAPRLLQAVAETPDPDRALVNLEKVTASLGNKGVLWELFSFNAPSLKLYVDLCAGSQFLSEILINNPGMIDELLDSLVLNQPRTAEELGAELSDLLRGATDPEPILHSFQNKELLRIGVSDILGKSSVREVTAALSDLAQTVLAQIAPRQTGPLERRLGFPSLADGPRAGKPARHVLLGLGKLGSREMSYHSDLDLILVYEGDGRTAPLPGSTRFDRFDLTDNFHFFTELAQRIIKATSQLGPYGRLYPVDMRLRPTGKSGSLVIPLQEFRRYYESDSAQIWERQSLTRARVVSGDAEFGEAVLAAVADAAYGLPWSPATVDAILEMRRRLEGSRRDGNLKRGQGGSVDVEFLVQLFKLKYAGTRPALRATNTWEALDALHQSSLLSGEDHALLRGNYDFLRQVECRLRLIHNRSLDELPEGGDLDKLARHLGFGEGGIRAADAFLTELRSRLASTRAAFTRLLERER